MLGLGFGALHSAGWQRGAHYRDLVGRQVADYYFSRTATPLTPFNRLKETLFGQAFDRGSGGKADDVTRHLIERVKDQPLLNRLLYVDTKSWLPDDLLVKADKMTMATSVELRVPLLDHHVLEFAASLPQRHKLRGWTLKRVLRSALQGAVPKEILKRRKAGFPVPYEAWMRNELNEFVCDTILAQSSFSSTYFSRPEVQSLIETHRRSGEGAKEVFSLLVLELWYQQFFRQPLTSRSVETPAYIDLPEVAA
jgi:asparagine synthase (glutamine-hydrolysing)